MNARTVHVISYAFASKNLRDQQSLLDEWLLKCGNLHVNQSHYRPEESRGFQEVKIPRLGDNGPGWW